MLRIFAVSLIMFAASSFAEEPGTPKLAAPAGWGGETIELPPGFAPDMRLKGAEHIRFAPGMMKPDSDTFFSYAFAFELQPIPELTEAVVEEEFLKYYRGLCKAVLGGKLPELDPSTFTLDLSLVELDKNTLPGANVTVKNTAQYTGKLNWVEPFATKRSQKLNLEILTWTMNDRNYLFACVSPQATDAAIWGQLRSIRDDYLKK